MIKHQETLGMCERESRHMCQRERESEKEELKQSEKRVAAGRRFGGEFILAFEFEFELKFEFLQGVVSHGDLCFWQCQNHLGITNQMRQSASRATAGNGNVCFIPNWSFS